jgi:hypothetical protein
VWQGKAEVGPCTLALVAAVVPPAPQVSAKSGIEPIIFQIIVARKVCVTLFSLNIAAY